VQELTAGDPEEVARENAVRKARAVAARLEHGIEAAERHTTVVLGVDTLVALDGRIYGKPPDEAAARHTLSVLAGATHLVVSGLALIGRDEQVLAATTAVTFRELPPPLLDWYVKTGEWQGRAGGYAIQGAGAALVRRVQGDYENVVGLPVATLLDACPQLLATTFTTR
jgi:septum formation protein